MTYGKNLTVKVSEFRKDMGKNPLGDKPLVRKSGQKYIIEYYPDSIAGKQLQIFRKAKENEEHFRKWKMVAETKDFENNDQSLREIFEDISPSTIRSLDK